MIYDYSNPLGTAPASLNSEVGQAALLKKSIGHLHWKYIMNLIVLIIILLLLFGGGGFYLGGPMVGGGLLGTILVIALIVYLMGGLRR